MYDEYLKTFICAAESGSFSKAAELLYLSPNAVKKRIGYIEENTGLCLFERTLKGIKLTPAGRSFYPDSKAMLKDFIDSVERARNIQYSHDNIVRIGIMDTFADEFLTAKWLSYHERTKGIKTSMLLYGNSSENLSTMFKSLGKDIDLAVDIYDEKTAKKFGISAVKLSEAKICCSVPENHRFAQKNFIEPKDLCGEKVMILKSGRNEIWDKLIESIKNDYFGIELEEIDDYSIRSLNRCENENKVMIITENGAGIYPFCKAVPMSVEYRIPFGIYYSGNGKKSVLEFVEKLLELVPEKE